jgi:cytochrome b561
MSEMLSDGDVSRPSILQLQKSVGLTVLLLSVARLSWRLVNPVPPLPKWMPPALRIAARASHVFLYFLIVAMRLTGWALVSSSRASAPTFYFGIFHWPSISFLAQLPRAEKIPLHPGFGLAHVTLAWSAILLVPLHVFGALYHHWRGDDVLRRMLPGTGFAG